MIAFEVFINGQKRFTAGGPEYQYLSGMLTLFNTQFPKPDDVSILFSMNGTKSEPLVEVVGTWPGEQLTVGDRVEIRVVEVAEVDAPESVEKYERKGH